MKSLKVIGAIALISTAMLASNVTFARGNGKSNHPEVQVYVTSQGLYIDCEVTLNQQPASPSAAY